MKRTRENPEENPKEPKVPKARTRAKHRKLVSQVLATRHQRQVRTLSNLHRHVPLITSWNDGWNCDEWNDCWSFDEWNDDWSSVGWHEGWEQTYDTSASSFSLGGLDVSATSSPKRFQWAKMNLGHRSCSKHNPIELWSRGEQEVDDSSGLPVVSGFLMVEVGNFKDATRTDCSDL